MGFVEQLYTFGDAGRDAPRATPGPDQQREISVGYLALTADAVDVAPPGARWTPVLDVFPWEDRRSDGTPSPIRSAVMTWSGSNARRLSRSEALFALTPTSRWDEGRVLERYELLYEAGLLTEAARDGLDATSLALGDRPMTSDHRRILATGLGRLRGKLKYRPVVFELMAGEFTLSALQKTVEAIAGIPLHKQNFRRVVERTGLVEGLGRMDVETGGRPAELFRFRREELQARPALGLSLPGVRD